jgi:DNA-directed RNA polymerase specialized sigma24 family protein
MGKDWALTQEAFDALLLWLDAEDRERAGAKYESIRKRLIQLFVCRGCGEPEVLADETFNRVARKMPQLSRDYVGDPALFFFGVAQNVYLESLRAKPKQQETDERPYVCLDRCMQTLTAENRDLVLRYYEEEKRVKIDHRQELAAHLGIAINALRIRAHRVRSALKQCVKNCLEQAA